MLSPLRNAIARRQYQVQYNKIQRMTRRKLGKVQLAALREKKWQELKGLTPYIYISLKLMLLA